MIPWQYFFSFTGRITRAQFWLDYTALVSGLRPRADQAFRGAGRRRLEHCMDCLHDILRLVRFRGVRETLA